jgi:hypothetical protein
LFKKGKSIFGVFVMLLVAIVTGVEIGRIYVDNLPANVIMNATEAELRDSDEDVAKLVKKSSSSTPDSFSAVELYEIAEYNFNQKDAFYKTSSGGAKNMVGTQTLYSRKVLRDGEFVFDNLSPGIVDVKTRVRYTVGASTVTKNVKGTWVEGSNQKKATFDSAYDETYTLDEYFAKFNSQPMTNITYVISSKICTSDSYSKVTKNSDGNYTFTISLSGNALTAAAVHYSYEIYYTSYDMLSDSAKKNMILPAWDKMTMTVVVDSNFDFVSISYDENYSVYTKFGYQAVNDIFTENFYFELDKIPTLQEVL